MDQPLYIVWKDEFNIGVNIIDEQHRGLVSIINSFYYHLQMGTSMAAMQPTLRMLEEYAKVHFATEEALLQKINYPGLAEHQLEHERLLLKSQQMLSTMRSEQDVWEIMPFLKKWWINHILEDDRQYMAMLR